MVAAEARLAAQQVEVPADGVDVLLDALLPRVKDDADARQEFLDLLETLGPDDPRVRPATARRCPPAVLIAIGTVAGARHRR